MSLKEQLLEKMKELDVQPKRSLGQNFLISEHVISEIFAHLDRRAPRDVVEIGPGLGVLTEQLIARPLNRKLIELDTRFAQYWKKRGEDVFEIDALQLNWSDLNLAQNTLLISNLPYQIGSRLVIDLSVKTPQIDIMILMFQKEVAERLTAEPRNKDYGFLSVVAQTFWYMDRIVDASEEDFFPKPNIKSRVMSFKRKKIDVQLGEEFVEFIKNAFQFRRKYLVKGFKNSEIKIKSALLSLGLNEKIRAEELSPAQFVQLFLLMQGTAK